MSSREADYREYHPARVLSPYVSCYWSSTTPTSVTPQDHRVLPDGCIDIIFDLSDQYTAGKVVGTMTRPLVFQTTTLVQFIAVRFRPGGAAPFLRLSAEEVTDSQCELPKFWQAERLEERLRGLHRPAERVQLLESVLLRRLSKTPPVDNRIQCAVAMINKGHAIEAIADHVGLSRQHLTRLFREYVGVGPKVFARVDRLQRLLNRIKKPGRLNWSSVGLELGYYDQAHMISECRSLAGLTPTELGRR